MDSKTRENIVWSAVLGGIYGFLPLLVISVSGLEGGGDPGPMLVYMFPLFWPALATWMLVASFLSLLDVSKAFLSSPHNLDILNGALWILLGGLIGFLEKKRREWLK